MLFYSLSYNKDKIIYSDNVTYNSALFQYTYNLNYSNLNNIFNETESVLLASNISDATIVNDGIVYLKDDILYYSDYKDQVKIANKVYDFAVTKDKNSIFYLNDDDGLYKRTINENENIKVSSNVMGYQAINNDVVYYKENKNDQNVYELYYNNKLITDRFTHYYGYSNNNLYYSINDSSENIEANLINNYSTEKLKYVEDSNVDDWVKATKKEKIVVTVLALSYCHYCELYKPIITEYAEDNGYDLYWFEVDTMSDSDYLLLTSTFEENSYDESSSYTFVTYNNEFLGDYLGYYSKEEVEENFSSIIIDDEEYNETDNSFRNYKTYSYSVLDESKNKKSDGLLYFDYDLKDFDRFNYIIYYKNNDDLEDDNVYYYIYDVENKKNIEIGDSEEIDIYNYNTNDNSFYVTKDDVLSRFIVSDGLIKNNKDIGKNVCLLNFNNNDTYFIDECNGDDIGKLHLYSDDKDITISDDVYNAYYINNQLFYIEKNNDDYESIYVYDESKSKLLVDDVYYSVKIDNYINYYISDYVSSSNSNIYADGYIYKNGEKIFIDSDMYVYFGLYEIE